MLSTGSKSSWKFREPHSLKADERILYEQFFNCDKSCLGFKVLLSQSLADHEGKSADGYTRSKENCDNFCLSGNDQIKLSFTGKTKSHLFFKIITQRILPVWFNGQRTYVDGL